MNKHLQLLGVQLYDVFISQLVAGPDPLRFEFPGLAPQDSILEASPKVLVNLLCGQ